MRAVSGRVFFYEVGPWDGVFFYEGGQGVNFFFFEAGL